MYLEVMTNRAYSKKTEEDQQIKEKYCCAWQVGQSVLLIGSVGSGPIDLSEQLGGLIRSGLLLRVDQFWFGSSLSISVC
jgi:hypothetical protein